MDGVCIWRVQPGQPVEQQGGNSLLWQYGGCLLGWFHCWTLWPTERSHGCHLAELQVSRLSTGAAKIDRTVAWCRVGLLTDMP